MSDSQGDEIVKKLREYFAEREMTQKQIGEALGVAQTTVSSLLNGKNFGPKSAATWSKAFGFRPNWLRTGEGPMMLSDVSENITGEPTVIVVDTSDLTVIPVISIEAAAGYGAFNSDSFDEEGVMKLPSSIVGRKKTGLYCIHIVGDSMSPTLADGSYVVISRLSRAEWKRGVRDGDVYVVNYGGETVIKRVSTALWKEGKLICSSDNKNKRLYPSFEVGVEDIHNIWEVKLYITSKPL